MNSRINLRSFPDFLKHESAGGIILFFCVIISLLIANSPLGAGFNNLLDTQLGFNTESIHLKYSVALWINDGLMAIFFLLVGLEIKRELVEGELASPKKAALPILCAIGGAVIPAGIYLYFNNGTDTAHGWGIPMATDIAFALAVITALGKRVPLSLKIFLAALAIVDDLLAILVIALFYSAELDVVSLAYGGAVFLLLIAFNRFGVKNIAFYLIPGVFMWYFIHHSGIHATVAGVLTALTLPTTPGAEESPLERLEHALVKPVNFIIIPIFALANTNIRFEDGMVDGLFSNLGMGIVLGLLIGKPVGIFLTSWLSVKSNLCQLPEGANWTQIIGVGLLAGIGFTMSIFIALLSFVEPEQVAVAKFSILTASALSGALGFLLLNITGRKI